MMMMFCFHKMIDHSILEGPTQQLGKFIEINNFNGKKLSLVRVRYEIYIN
jgi:hypothetical protein